MDDGVENIVSNSAWKILNLTPYPVFHSEVMNRVRDLINTRLYRYGPLYTHISLQSPFLFNPTRANRHQTAVAAVQSPMEAAGTDSDGREFKNPNEMWSEHTGDNNKKTQWYRDGVAYWEGVEASVDGVLGGYGHVNDADVKGSEGFIQTLLAELFVDGGIDRHFVALDCGSGIGRITKNLLIRYFNEVDLLEPVSHFLDAARENLVQENPMASDKHKATNFYCVPLQEFTPDVGRYDVIWIQWCIGHLTDDDFVSFFKRAKIGLKPGGLFVLKENLARNGFVLDKEDRSITRSDSYFKELFSRCGLHLYKSREQKGLPRELFAVKMYALTTDIPKRVSKTRSKVQASRPGIIK